MACTISCAALAKPFVAGKSAARPARASGFRSNATIAKTTAFQGRRIDCVQW